MGTPGVGQATTVPDVINFYQWYDYVHSAQHVLVIMSRLILIKGILLLLPQPPFIKKVDEVDPRP